MSERLIDKSSDIDPLLTKGKLNLTAEDLLKDAWWDISKAVKEEQELLSIKEEQLKITCPKACELYQKRSKYTKDIYKSTQNPLSELKGLLELDNQIIYFFENNLSTAFANADKILQGLDMNKDHLNKWLETMPFGQYCQMLNEVYSIYSGDSFLFFKLWIMKDNIWKELFLRFVLNISSKNELWIEKGKQELVQYIIWYHIMYKESPFAPQKQ